MIVEKFINHPIQSNTYVLDEIESEYCLIIDPGGKDMSEVINYIRKRKKKISSILLTHEHFDHIYGINHLLIDFPDLTIYSSKKTLQRISNPRKNLSLYYDQIGFKVSECKVEELVEGHKMIEFAEVIVLNTIGHTDSSVSFLIEDLLFTGDFLIKDETTVTKLPTGSKVDLQISIDKYFEIINNSSIYPGHGEIFKI